jgi:hypothetical protein
MVSTDDVNDDGNDDDADWPPIFDPILRYYTTSGSGGNSNISNRNSLASIA